MPNIGFWAVAGASAPVVAGAFDLLETAILASNTASVTFDVSTYAALGYKHLQVRYAARGDRGATLDAMIMRFNADTGNNYNSHGLYGNGSSAESSYESGNTSSMDLMYIPAASASANIFGAGVIDILDPFASTKNKTKRSFSGSHSENYVQLSSGLWRNTAAVTSITFDQRYGSNFVTASRFSIYGLKG